MKQENTNFLQKIRNRAFIRPYEALIKYMTRFAGEGYSLCFAGNNVTFATVNSYTKFWFHKNRYFSESGLHEPTLTKIFERLSLKKDTLIDVGAHMGYFSILWSSCSGKKAIGFELDPKNFQLLKEIWYSLPVEHQRRASFYNFGVSNENTEIFYNLDSSPSPTKSLIREKIMNHDVGKNGKVCIYTIDNIVNRFNFIPDIIKIDTEGFEFNVVQGAIKTIDEFKPIFLIEIHPKKLCLLNYKTQDLIEFFIKHEYDAYLISSHRKKIGVLIPIKNGEYKNNYNHDVIFIHKSADIRDLELNEFVE